MADTRITAAEAASRLGVKRETIYAYVSRGLLTSERHLDGKSSTFDPAEIDRLRRKKNLARLLDAVERALSGESTCDSPTGFAYYDPMSNDNFPLVAQHQIDLAVQALACGMTNVVTLQLSHTVGPTVFSWLGQTDGHHSLSHSADTDPTNVANFVACERWYAEQFAYLLDQLSLAPDPETGGSMLDSTLVFWAQELGDGRLHTCEAVPWVLAGSGGGFFSPGRYLDLGGATHDAVLTSIAHAFGLELPSYGVGTAGPLEVLR